MAWTHAVQYGTWLILSLLVEGPTIPNQLVGATIQHPLNHALEDHNENIPFFLDVLSSDYCMTERGREYCQWTCCGSFKSEYCCMSPYTIAGIVFGAIALICTIVATIFCICQYKKQKAQVTTTQRIFVVNGGNNQYQHSAYPHTTGPLAPGYNTQYGMQFNGISPPAYSTLRPHSKKGPPATVHPATEPGAPPPPPPAYSPPPEYPFRRAAEEAFRK